MRDSAAGLLLRGGSERRSPVLSLGPGGSRSCGRSWHQVRTSGRPAVIMSWHEALLPVLWQHRAQGVSRGDECWARRSASGCVRPPNRLSDHLWVKQSWRCTCLAARRPRAAREGRVVGFTPDGPRGPRRVITRSPAGGATGRWSSRPGSRREAHPAWRLASWDTMLIPKPFAKVRIAYGAPFFVEPGARGAFAIAEARAQESLEEVTRLTAWPDGAAIPTG